MADAYFIVTLSSADAGSGPNYDVFYSTDCVSYSAAAPATVSLPTIGSQATITVPDNTQCVKLTNINSNCVNSVSSSVNITTTTTSTTTTTTTTTTTAAPATTTTTAAPATTTTTAGKRLEWNYLIDGGANGVMTIYINGDAVETRNTNSSGTWPLNTDDTIYFEVYTAGCSGGNNFANSYTLAANVSYGILTDASCAIGTTTLTTGTYTVQSSDTIIDVSAFSSCDSGCV